MNLLTRKLENFCRLSDRDRWLLDEVVANKRWFRANVDIIHEDDPPSDVHLILQGFACRNKISSDGVRQIVAYLVPGDFCDLPVAVLKQMDHSITTLSECEVVDIPLRAIEAMTERPALARALWWATLVDEATLREWIVNLGSRDARQKLAHLLCELLVRLRAVGMANADEYSLPITQRDLADTVGLSAVQLNRSLQGLRADGLVEFQNRVLTVRNFEKLAELSGFNPNYLHIAKTTTVRTF